MPTTTTTPPPVLFPESLCLLFYMVDDDNEEIQGISGTYKLTNTNPVDFAPGFYVLHNAFENLTFRVLHDGNKWVFRFYTSVGDVIGEITQIDLKTWPDGVALIDPNIAPLDGSGNYKGPPYENRRSFVTILDNCVGVDLDRPKKLEKQFFKQSLFDHTRMPNALPRIMSGDGVEVVSLTGNHIGISFNPKESSDLTGNLITFDTFGSVFRIDAAYNESQFVINELRTPRNNSSTVFTFLTAFDYPISVFRSSSVINSEILRIKLLGYI